MVRRWLVALFAISLTALIPGEPVAFTAQLPATNDSSAVDEEPEEDDVAASDCAELYGVSPGSDALLRIDPDTGAGEVIGPLGIAIDNVGLDFDRRGRLWGFSRSTDDPGLGLLYRIDLTTGAAEVVQTFDVTGIGIGVGLEFGPDGKTLYWISARGLSILDVETGEVILVARLPFPSNNLTLIPGCSDFLTYDQEGDRLVRVSSVDGAVEEIGPSNMDLPIAALAFAPDGRVVGAAGRNLYSFDLATGAATFIGDIGRGVAGLAFRPSFRRSFCVDARFDPATNLSRWVVRVNRRVRHSVDGCRRGEECGKCGATGFYRLHPNGRMLLQTPEVPAAGDYRVQFLVRAPEGGPARLQVRTESGLFRIGLDETAWSWTEPITAALEEGSNLIALRNAGRLPIDVEKTRIERACAESCEKPSVRECLDRRFDPETGLSRVVREIGGAAGHSERDGVCGAEGFYFVRGRRGFLRAEVEVPETGRYLFSFRYRIGAAGRDGEAIRVSLGARTVSLGERELESTREWEWSPAVEVFLEAGLQSILFESIGRGAVHLENIRLQRACECDVAPPPNEPPTVDAGGPYSVDEGGSVLLTATGSDPEGEPLEFKWDLDGDEIFETPGESVTFSAADLDGPSSVEVSVQVTDVSGLTATSSATVEILNVAPTAEFANTSGRVNVGRPARLVFSNATDPSAEDLLAGLLYSYDCTNDGVFELADSPEPAFDCVYSRPGTFTARGRVSDKDGGSSDYRVAVGVVRRPDLVAEAVFWEPNPAVEGDSVTVGFRVRNAGVADSGPFHLMLTRDGSLMCDWEVPGLAPGAVFERGPGLGGATCSGRYGIPSARVPGHRVVFTVDDRRQVAELDERNNVLRVFIPVSPAATRVDLVAQDLFWSPDPVRANDAVTIGFRVRNAGDRAAGAFHLQLMRDGRPMCDWDVPGLAAGAVFERGPGLPGATCSGIYGIPSAEPPGHEVRFTVDDRGEVPESTESNNTLTKFVPVRAR